MGLNNAISPIPASMRYQSSTTPMTSTLTTVVYSTALWDLLGNYSAGVFTCTVAGRYQLNACISMTGGFLLNSMLNMIAVQSGSATQTSEFKGYSAGAVTQMRGSVGDIFSLQPGDTLRIQASNTGSTPVIAATTTQNWLSIARLP